ncbi:MAG: hypothetical protein AUH43_17780 [Acidobacteria bacterium 13_1_40CM_65_14]|nr:MAG: hypothetical protein AUH43_17780 [Acidobacteria bacterium 13_1_40CM_65_14]
MTASVRSQQRQSAAQTRVPAPRRVAQLCSFYELANELKKIQRTYSLKTTSGRRRTSRALRSAH